LVPSNLPILPQQDVNLVSTLVALETGDPGEISWPRKGAKAARGAKLTPFSFLRFLCLFAAHAAVWMTFNVIAHAPPRLGMIAEMIERDVRVK
jgi:hypothetical protein